MRAVSVLVVVRHRAQLGHHLAQGAQHLALDQVVVGLLVEQRLAQVAQEVGQDGGHVFRLGDGLGRLARPQGLPMQAFLAQPGQPRHVRRGREEHQLGRLLGQRFGTPWVLLAV